LLSPLHPGDPLSANFFVGPLIPVCSCAIQLERNENKEAAMRIWVQEAVAGVSLLVFVASAIVLSAAGQALLAT
jgi:hypothetical protein